MCASVTYPPHDGDVTTLGQGFLGGCRAMRCGDELELGEIEQKTLADVSLPLRMKVQLDLIDQHNCVLSDRGFRLFGKASKSPRCQIHGPRKHRLVTEAEVCERCLTRRGLYKNAGLIFAVPAWSANFDVLCGELTRQQRATTVFQRL